MRALSPSAVLEPTDAIPEAVPAAAQHRSLKIYLLVFSLLTPVFAALFYASLLMASSASCGNGFGRPDEFLGYCETTWFGDYEHAAVAYATKPAFIRNAAGAELLFLGDSRMQTAVSSEAVKRFLDQRDIRFFAFGFGYGESERFPLTMLERIRARPRIVFVNADSFFNTQMSPIGNAILGGNPAERAGTYLRYLPKTLFEANIAGICDRAPMMCRWKAQPRSWMRSSVDGRWRWINGDPDKVDRSITSHRDRQLDPAVVARSRAAVVEALARLQALGVGRSCVVVTGVPNPVFESERWGRAIATAHGLPYVEPNLTGLGVRDGLHLTQSSADRWSAALLSQAEPLIHACLAGAAR